MWNISIIKEEREMNTGNGSGSTFVFLIKAFRAPTPPRSPADMPSTSSMIRTDLSVISTPEASVVYEKQALVKHTRGLTMMDHEREGGTHLSTRHPSI